MNKIETNKQRDIRKINEIQALGWKVVVVWECQLKTNKDYTLKELVHNIQ